MAERMQPGPEGVANPQTHNHAADFLRERSREPEPAELLARDRRTWPAALGPRSRRRSWPHSSATEVLPSARPCRVQARYGAASPSGSQSRGHVRQHPPHGRRSVSRTVSMRNWLTSATYSAASAANTGSRTPPGNAVDCPGSWRRATEAVSVSGEGWRRRAGSGRLCPVFGLAPRCSPMPVLAPATPAGRRCSAGPRLRRRVDHHHEPDAPVSAAVRAGTAPGRFL